jgi:hypothetical protein
MKRTAEDGLIGLLEGLNLSGENNMGKKRLKGKCGKRRRRRGRAAKNNGVKFPRRQRGGGFGAIAMSLARRVIPKIVRYGGRKVLLGVARQIPVELASAAGEKLLTQEIKKRRASRFTFLGSLRYAAGEKAQEIQRWQRAKREGTRLYRQRRAEEVRQKRLTLLRKKKKRRRSAGKSAPASDTLRAWRTKIQRAKNRAHRQIHVERALNVANKRRGLPTPY